MAALHPLDRFARRLTDFADQTEPEFVIPSDLAALSDEELTQLHEQAVAHFDSLFNDGQGLDQAAIDALTVLTEGIESLVAELDVRGQAAADRTAAAQALAARAHPSDAHSADGETDGGDGEVDTTDGEGDGEGDGTDDEEETPAEETDGATAVVTAAAPRREIRVNLAGLTRRAPAPRPAHEATTMRDVVLAAGDGGVLAAGTGMNWDDVGRAIDRRLTGFSQSQYESAQRSGTHLRQQFSVATLRKPIAPELTVQNNDPSHVDEVLQRARNEHRLPGGSLVAAGGWCAPSETLYQLCELESRDGLVSVPTIGVARSGIQFTLGPTFQEIYDDTGFAYTEQDAIDGDWDGQGGGSKPCYQAECPPFSEVRLQLAGLCINAGLLQQRGFPELIARTTRGALVAHDHKMSANVINAIVAGSTAVTMTAGQAGATAPLLDAIELQVEHFRYSTRLARSTTLEAIFPYWVRGVVRADLSRRTGIDLISVTDAMIDGWFAQRGIAVQYVYDWQPITGAATAFKAWPATVKFLLYAAGTWVQGGGDLITLDTIYDSTLLGQNEFTALFTEESWLVAKLCHDSRVIEIALCGDGSTAAGVDIGCDGVAVVVGP